MEKVLEIRRKALLQTMMQGILALILVAFVAEVIESWDYLADEFMIPILLATLVVLPIFLFINKHIPSWIVALVWQTFTFTVIYFTDTPEGLIAGKSSLVWVIAILPAAFIAPPWASFASAGVVTSMIFWLATKSTITYGQLLPGVNVYLVSMLWIIALLSWLASKNMIEALQNAYDEQEKLNAILDNAADGIVVLDTHGEIERANPVALSYFEGEIEELAKPENNSELTVPGGRILSLNWALVPGVGNVAIVRDVTRDIEVGHMKDAMLAVVSHELRTPLAGILGAADLMQMSPPSMEKALEIIRRNGKRLLRLVNDLLDRAQIESGEFNLVAEPFPPKELERDLTDLVNHHRKKAVSKIVLDFQFDRENLIQGDLGRIIQVLRNLVDNAVKFTLEGQVTVNVRVEDALITAEVIDTGEGIPIQQLPDIWKPFRRSSDFGVRKFQGVGLGLSIVHGLIEKMSGEVEVESTVGKGSVFTVRLPLKYIDVELE